MNKRLLGKTGLKVSEVSFGGVEIGLPYGIGVDSRKQMLNEAEAIRLLSEALDSGINFFDTARAYGQSEQLIGKAFKKKREQVIICTKCEHFCDDSSHLPPIDQIRKITDNSLEKSLSVLQTDYIDIFMSHEGGSDTVDNEEIGEIFSEYKRKGLTKAIGISTYSVEETKRAIESRIWDVIQLPLNLMDQRQSHTFTLAQKHNVGIIVRSVLFRGILTDKGRSLHPKLKTVEQHRNVYSELLSEQAPELSDLATKFALSFKEVSSVLIGIDQTKYLHRALAIANGKYLDAQTLKKIRQLSYPEPDFLNLHLWDTMDWLK